jgi:hypothetical protein
VTVHMRPVAHRYTGGQPEISVDTDGDFGTDVVLTIESGPDEMIDDMDMCRTLTPVEARTLAAMLNHKANEAERRYE